MIGVMFSFLMRCRIPVLLATFNIIVRSACTQRPKLLPIYVNNVKLNPTNYYGSSYNLNVIKKDKSNDNDNDNDDDDDETQSQQQQTDLLQPIMINQLFFD